MNTINAGDIQYARFRAICSVVLGGIVGFLIGLPTCGIEQVSSGRCWLPIFFIIAGGIIGYKKRANTFFFYFSLFAILILSVVLLTQGM